VPEERDGGVGQRRVLDRLGVPRGEAAQPVVGARAEPELQVHLGPEAHELGALAFPVAPGVVAGGVGPFDRVVVDGVVRDIAVDALVDLAGPLADRPPQLRDLLRRLDLARELPPDPVEQHLPEPRRVQPRLFALDVRDRRELVAAEQSAPVQRHRRDLGEPRKLPPLRRPRRHPEHELVLLGPPDHEHRRDFRRVQPQVATARERRQGRPDPRTPAIPHRLKAPALPAPEQRCLGLVPAGRLECSDELIPFRTVTQIASERAAQSHAASMATPAWRRHAAPSAPRALAPRVAPCPPCPHAASRLPAAPGHAGRLPTAPGRSGATRAPARAGPRRAARPPSGRARRARPPAATPVPPGGATKFA